MRRFFNWLARFWTVSINELIDWPGWPRRLRLLAMTEPGGCFAVHALGFGSYKNHYIYQSLKKLFFRHYLTPRHGEEPQATWPSRNFYILTLFIMFFMSGCGSLTGINSAESRLTHGWSDVIEEDMTNQRPLYCYKTIGTVDCYEHPIPERRDQLVTQYPAPLKNRRHRKIWSMADDSDFNRRVHESYERHEGERHPEPMTPAHHSFGNHPADGYPPHGRQVLYPKQGQQGNLQTLPPKMGTKPPIRPSNSVPQRPRSAAEKTENTPLS